jgi:hypothetical protein
MKNVANAVTSIDWPKLQVQKLYLLHLTETGHDTPALWGVIQLIDAIQDAAVEDGVVTEVEAFIG